MIIRLLLLAALVVLEFLGLRHLVREFEHTDVLGAGVLILFLGAIFGLVDLGLGAWWFHLRWWILLLAGFGLLLAGLFWVWMQGR